MRAPDGSSSVAFTTYGPSASHVDAKLSDLRLTAATFRTVADECDGHFSTVFTIEWNLPFRGDVLSPGTSAACAKAILGLTIGKQGLMAAQVRASIMAAFLDYSVKTYEDAELIAGQFVDRLALPADLVMTGLKLNHVIADAISGKDVDLATIQREAPDAIDMVVQVVSDVLPGPYAQDITALHAATIVLTGVPKRVGTRLTSDPNSATKAPEVRSVSEAAGRIPELYKNPENAGHIQVQRVVDPTTGQGAWTLILPGTSTFAPNGKNGFNGNGNLYAAAGRQSPVEAAALTALRQAMAKEGVAGKGEPVIVLGHSQGGMVATNMARHQQKGDINITHVVTYGSPVGHLKVPHKTSVLNVENSADPVHRIDGRANGTGEPNRTRVVFTDPGSLTAPDGSTDNLEAHSMARYKDNYQAIVEQVRSHPESQVAQYEHSTEKFFTGNARTYTFDLATVDPSSETKPSQPPQGKSEPYRPSGAPLPLRSR